MVINKKDIIKLSIISLIGAYYSRLFLIYTSSMITSDFVKPIYSLETILTSINVIMIIYYYFRNTYIKSYSKQKTIVLSIINIVLSIIALTCYILSFKTNINNLKNNVDNFYISIYNVIAYIIVISYSFYRIFKFKETNVNINFNKYKQVLLFILMFFYFYGISNIYYFFIAIRNITIYPFGYIVLLLISLLFIYNFINLILTYKNNKKLIFTNLIINLIVVLLFILSEIINFSYIPEIGKIFIPFDFSISLALFEVFLIIHLLLNCTYNIKE